MKLAIFCCECGVCAHATFDGCKLEPRTVFGELGWFFSVVSRESGGVLALLCDECAPKVYEPPLLEAAKDAHRKGILWSPEK